jgi:NADH-quinone oxidoreductase subunit H
MNELLVIFGVMISMVGALLTTAALLTLVERRFLGFLQDRKGPNRAGPFGLLQPVADGLKLMFKEDWVPPFADRVLFTLAPCIVMVTGLLSFAVIPLASGFALADLDVGLLFVLALASVSVYSVILGGWASNSKYSLLGSLRAAAQMISYELALGLSLAGVVFLAGSFRLGDIVEAQAGLWFVVLQPAGFLIFLVAALAESRRLPFDLPEAENEIVAGFHTEYSSMKFAMFFIGEYVGLTLFSVLAVTFFFGGWRGPWLPGPVWLMIKSVPFVLAFIWFRASLPRPRYDQLMALGWKALLPLALLNVLVTGGVALCLKG